nr:uncharacterized protein LOC109170740 [Ipomoea trifida]
MIDTTDEPSSGPQQPVVRKSTRQRQVSTYPKDYVCHTSMVKTSPHDISKLMSYTRLSPSFHSFVINIACDTEPNSYDEEVKHECWQKAP